MNDKDRMTYTKPELEVIEIAAQEILGSGCNPLDGCPVVD